MMSVCIISVSLERPSGGMASIAPTNPDWSNVMHGTISGSTINADWTDVPKGSIMQYGMLTLQIQSNNRIVALSKTGGFAGSVWTR